MIAKWRCAAPCTGKVVRIVVDSTDKGQFSSPLGTPEPVARGSLWRCETYGLEVKHVVAIIVEDGSFRHFPVPMVADVMVAVGP